MSYCEGRKVENFPRKKPVGSLSDWHKRERESTGEVAANAPKAKVKHH